jgi:cytochrome c peroxidase
MFGEHPVEMGLAGREREMLQRLAAVPRYPPLFRAAFPGEDAPLGLANVTRAIAAYQRTLISGDSPYDRYKRGGPPGAFSESARRGEGLFFSDRLECFHCHGGFTFSQTVDYEGKAGPDVEFHTTGLYNVDGRGAYPAGNTGLFEVTRRPQDMGRFKPPTLRNIARTAPYMHDGSIATLDEVIDHYAAGGRTIREGPNAGVGRDNPYKSRPVKGFALTAQERADLLAFLESLTDTSFLEDPKHRDPWSAAAASSVPPASAPVPPPR